MSLLDELARDAQGADTSLSPDQSGALVRRILESLGGGDPDSGVEGLGRSFARNGLGDVFDSWVGTGRNREIAPDDLSRALSGSPLSGLTKGLAAAAGAAALAKLLPALIDRLTPEGRVPARERVGQMTTEILRGGDPFAQRREGTTMASSSGKGERPRPDFSDVQAGSSSTAAAPSPKAKAEERTYTVVAGDSLSKISKRFYGNANQWRRIFEANRDQIKDPDLIHPGQVLRIPEA
jgi:uncharacterized protein YidB (DUF937 family)